MVSSPTDYTLDGRSTKEKRIQFDPWGQSYADVKAVIAATDAVLDGFQGTLSEGTVVLGSFRSEEIDLTDQYSRAFRTMIEYHFHSHDSQGQAHRPCAGRIPLCARLPRPLQIGRLKSL